MRKPLIVAWISAALLAGCGGTNLTSESSSSTGTGTGGTTTVLLGSGVGSAFQSGSIAAGSKSLSAGGSTSLSVNLVDKTGALYTTSTVVTFNSTCAAEGKATITGTGAGSTAGSPAVTTTTGTAVATYVATGCSGADVVTASAAPNSENLTATVTVNVAASTVGSISFISATPSNITLKGVGSVGGSATSTVIFKVLDSSGGPVSGASVTFTLNSSAGGVSIAPLTATSDANGQVQTIVSGGTAATSVRVTATTVTGSGASISTESNTLTVSTGIPTSKGISLAVLCPNVEAFNNDGVVVPVTVRMTDRFSNPVPDGTTASFQTTLGGIQATCTTSGGASSGAGSCSANWVSTAPRTVAGNPQSTAATAYTNPAYCNLAVTGVLPGLCNGTTNGRSPIMVTAIGEESFVDALGSGAFDGIFNASGTESYKNGDTVAFDASNADNNFPTPFPAAPQLAGKPKPWQDTSDPFLNEWEISDAAGNPKYFLGEPFIDYLNKAVFEGPDNLIESALCENPPGDASPVLCNSAQGSVAIGASNIIILSGNSPNFLFTYPSVALNNPPTLSYGGNPSVTVTMEIYDDREQQMPSGTTVVPSVAPATAGVLTGPLPAAWPCASAAPYVDGGLLIAGQFYTFTVTAPTSGLTAGALYVTVTTPKGLISTIAIPITP